MKIFPDIQYQRDISSYSEDAKVIERVVKYSERRKLVQGEINVGHKAAIFAESTEA